MARPRGDVEPEVPKVLEKALRILDAFDERSPRWTEAGLRRELGLPSTTLNRILRGLEHSGYLLRDEDGRYRLGLAAIRLGHRASESLDLAAMLDSLIRGVARETDELAMLAQPDFAAGAAVYVASVESTSRLRVTAEVGSSVPLTAGATARAILAFQPEARIEAVLARPLRRLAAGTLTDPAAVRERLARTRSEGWSLSWEETYDGAWAVAAPLLSDDAQTALAALGIAAPTSRHTPALEDSLRSTVLAAARDAARTLGDRRREP